MVSVEEVGLESLFVEGHMMSNKYWVGLVNFPERQMIVELFIDDQIVINYNT